MERTSYLSQIAKITDNLYLSSFAGATEHNFKKFGITCVISVCKETPKIELPNLESVKLNVLDRPNELLSLHFDTLTDKIHEIISEKKGSCLVHCVAGISRSATIILAYLMKYLKISLKEAHSHVKSKRPFIRPNLGFWKQLVDYEKSLFQTNSVRIIPSNIGFIPDVYENEVRSMYWARNNPHSAGTLAAQNKSPKTSTSNIEEHDIVREKKENSSIYTTTYKSSFQAFPKS
ncbi:unnamed protein product [Brachionus calyciflorus]|uniref:Protein-tyrosine-phosphatase n=1 Tax=Brachionus calyciflorus TaxID=104777 RepID=A0A813RR01_9BILA|nr:unnamed protein product [Brachionus calyciflorus]